MKNWGNDAVEGMGTKNLGLPLKNSSVLAHLSTCYFSWFFLIFSALYFRGDVLSPKHLLRHTLPPPPSPPVLWIIKCAFKITYKDNLQSVGGRVWVKSIVSISDTEVAICSQNVRKCQVSSYLLFWYSVIFLSIDF